VTETHPPRQRIASPTLWALTSGISGFVVDVLLVLDQLTENVGEVRQYFMWLPAAIACVLVVQFLTLIPVALALREWLPPTRSVRLATAAAVGAMLAVAILQLLVTGALEFEVQVVLVMATFLLVSTWVLTVGSTGHRRSTLPRLVSRFGIVLGCHTRWAWSLPGPDCCSLRDRLPGSPLSYLAACSWPSGGWAFRCGRWFWPA
jgi:hypothetical protein